MTIREALPTDALDIARLTMELGYTTDEEAVRERLGRIANKPDSVVWVAVDEGHIVGWIQVRASLTLESGDRVEIVGLVVGENFRRRGIGSALVKAAEDWALGTGSRVLVVRAQLHRQESHGFYLALGFCAAKTQVVYRKLLKHKLDSDTIARTWQ